MADLSVTMHGNPDASAVLIGPIHVTDGKKETAAATGGRTKRSNPGQEIR